MPAPPPPRTHLRWLIGLVLLTLAIRAPILYLQRSGLDADVDNYRELAESLLVEGKFALRLSTVADLYKLSPLGGHETAYRPPLYPYLLSYAAFGNPSVPHLNIALLHLVLGAGMVALTFQLGTQLLSDARLAALAALLVACDPILLNQQSLVMTETLAAFCAVLALWQLHRLTTGFDYWNAALAGGALGLATLCRPTFLPWLALAGLAITLQAWRASWRQLAIAPLAFTLGAALLLWPWAYRNYCLFGKPILTTTHGGFTFYLGNNAEFFGYLRSGDTWAPWDAGKFERKQVQIGLSIRLGNPSREPNEIRYSNTCYQNARKEIAAEPDMFLWACLYRIRQLWTPLPYRLSATESAGRTALRYLTAAWYCGVYALALVGIWRLRNVLVHPPWLWGVLLCLVFTGVHTLYWSNLRMRAPLIPYVALVAAAGCGELTAGASALRAASRRTRRAGRAA